MNTKKTWVKDLLILSLLMGLLFGILLGARYLQTPDEGRYVEIPREMLVLHDYITPHINFIKYFEKPVLFYWMEALQIKLFGLSLWSVRIPTALMGVLGCLFTYIATRKLYGRACGLLAAFILSSSLLYFIMAHTITLDMTLTTWLTGALLSFLLAMQERGRKKDILLWAMYLFAALAVLTKGLVGIIFPGMIIFVWTLIFNEWKSLKSWRIFSGILLVLLINLPWHLWAQIRNPEFFHYYVIEQQFLRYFTSYASREQAFWFLPSVLFFGFLPWIFFLIQSVYSSLVNLKGKENPERKTLVFLLLWAGLIYLFFQCSHSQLMPYILPIFPALSIVVARYFCSLAEVPRSRGVFWGLMSLSIFAVLFILAMALILMGVFGPYQQLILGLNAHYFIASGLIFFAIPIFAWVAYRNKSIPHVAIVLILGMDSFCLSVLINRAAFEQNSSYALAQKIQENWKPGSQVFVYEDYFQDLPVYLKRKVILVNNLNNLSELTFGAEHQNMKNDLISPADFWKKIKENHLTAPWFIVMSTDNERCLSTNQKAELKVLLRTNREVLFVGH